MKLIRHMVFSDIEGGKLLINTLKGTMLEISDEVHKIIEDWQHGQISTKTDFETALLNELDARGYLMESEAEERRIKDDILHRLRHAHEKTQASPGIVAFVLTYDCNFACPYCFLGKGKTGGIVMSDRQIDEALDLAGGTQNVVLFGGEPLLPKTMPVVRHLVSKTKGKSIGIVTNGYYLVEFYDLLSSANLGSVMVTLDGEEKTHDSRRFLAGGGATFGKIMEGIRLYLAGGIPIRVRMNLNKDTLEEGRRLKTRLLSEFSAYSAIFSLESGPVFEAKESEKIHMAKELYLDDMEYSIQERVRRNGMIGCSYSILDSIALGRPLLPKYAFCYAHENVMVFDPHGNIYPCLACVGVDEFAMGSYCPKKTEFKDNSIRNRNIESIPECSDCIYSLICGCGCPLKLKGQGDVMRPSCSSIKDQIHGRLPVVYQAMKRMRGVS